MESALIKSRAKYKELIANGVDSRRAYGIALGSYSDTQKPTITPEQIAAAAPKSVATMPVTNTVSNIAPATLSMPKAPKIIETTKNIMPIMGGDNRSGNAMPMMVSEIGQDLPDRTLAHIVTGGVGGI